jgi:hypothetical protein
VIVRISGEGQFRLSDDHLARLNELDNRAVSCVEGGDEEGFRALLSEMVSIVHSQGEALADDELEPSDIVIPPVDTTFEEARADFSGEGLIPG